MALRSKAQICDCSVVVIAGSNPVEGVDIRLFGTLCVVYVAVSATS